MSARRVLRAGGLWFDGVSAYASTSFGLRSYPATVMAWVCYNTLLTTTYTNIVSQGVSATDRTWQIGHHRFSPYPFRVVLYFTDGSSVYFLSSTPISVGKWYHVALVIGVSAAELYIDGALERSVAYDKALKTGGVVEIGRLSRAAEYHPGLIDDVRIYNRALSADEIRAIYERGALIRDGLVLHLDFSEYEGNIAYDKSGRGNHATIYGARWVVKKALYRM
ncbi:MAG: LamG domain-containing protein [Thermofilum sp.]